MTILAVLATLWFTLTAASGRTGGTLNLVTEGSYNQFNVTVSASVSIFSFSDTETTTATGTVNAWFDANPATGATTALALTGGNLAMSDVHLQLKNWLMNVADLSSSGMGGTAFTAAPPTTATPTANGGTFSAAGERLRIDRGTLSGTTINGDVNVDFSQTPIEGAGSGTGSVALGNPVGSTHTATLIVPVDFTTTQDMGGTVVTVRVQGTLKAVGTVSSLFTWGGGTGNWTDVNWTPGPVGGSAIAGLDAAIPGGTVNVNTTGVDAMHSITIGSGGRLNTYNYNGFNTYQTFSNLVLQGGTFYGSGYYDVWGAAKLPVVTASGSAASLVSSASWFDLDTTSTFSVADATGSSAADLTVSARLQDCPTGFGTRTAAALVKTGAGTMVLTGPNGFTGNTTINGGVLEIGTTGRLYNGGYTNSPVIAVNAGGTLRMPNYAYNGSSGQLADHAARRVLNGGTIEVTGTTHSSGQDFTVYAAGGTFRYKPATTSNTLTLRGNANSNITLSGPLTFDVLGNISVSPDPAVTGADGIIAGTGVLTKTGAGTLTLGGANTYSGNTTVEGGTLMVAGGLYRGGYFSGPVVTVRGGGVLELQNWHYDTNTASLGGLATEAGRIIVDGGTIRITGTAPTSYGRGVVVNAGGATLEAAAGAQWTVDTTTDSRAWVFNGNPTLTLAGAGTGVFQKVINSGTGGVVKTGAGVWTLGGVNTYTGNTVVAAGTLVLADNAGLKFVIGANGVNNKVTGAGAATLDGDFTLDLAGANPTPGNKWTLVDVAAKSFGPTFTLAGFTETAGVHTMTDAANRVWTFSESTGILAVAEAGYGSWVNRYPALPADQRDPDDDLDADGYDNLLEYVLGGSPLAADAAAIAPTGTPDGLGNFVLVFQRSDLSETDTTLVVQHSDDLSGWTDLAVHPAPAGPGVVVAEDFPTAELDTVTVTIPTGGAPRFFARLMATKP